MPHTLSLTRLLSLSTHRDPHTSHQRSAPLWEPATVIPDEVPCRCSPGLPVGSPMAPISPPDRRHGSRRVGCPLPCELRRDGPPVVTDRGVAAGPSHVSRSAQRPTNDSAAARSRRRSLLRVGSAPPPPSSPATSRGVGFWRNDRVEAAPTRRPRPPMVLLWGPSGAACPHATPPVLPVSSVSCLLSPVHLPSPLLLSSISHSPGPDPSLALALVLALCLAILPPSLPSTCSLAQPSRLRP